MQTTQLQELLTRNMKFRPSFGLAMCDLLREYRDAVFLVADSARGCRFKCPEDLKDRVVECGIAEQNMIGVAAGMARGGKKPVVFAFSPFASERCFEQIKIDAAYSGLNIVIVGSEGGVGLGTQGVTHYGWEDVALMRALPGMTVLCPGDHLEMHKCLRAAFDIPGPVYIRLTGGIPSPLHDTDYAFEVGKSIELRAGRDACIISSGTMLPVALEAARTLEAEGTSVSVINMHTIKPLDEAAVNDAAQSVPAIITLEEHSIVNGLGSAVADVLAQSSAGVKFRKIGLPDAYPHAVSPYAQMLADYSLTAEGVAQALRSLLSGDIAKEREREA